MEKFIVPASCFDLLLILLSGPANQETEKGVKYSHLCI